MTGITWEQMASLLALCGTMVAIIKSISDTRRNGRKDIEANAGEREGMRRDIKHILQGVEKIGKTQEKQLEDYAELCERVTATECMAREALDRAKAAERRGAG